MSVPISHVKEKVAHSDPESMRKLKYCQLEIQTLEEDEHKHILEIKNKFKSEQDMNYKKRGELLEEVSSFWCMGFLCHPNLEPLLVGEQRDSFRYLKKLEIHKPQPYIIQFQFHFTENPYFVNQTLVKEINLEHDVGKPISTSVPIQWKVNVDFHIPNECECLKYAKSFYEWYNFNNNLNAVVIGKSIVELWTDPLKWFDFNLGSDSETHTSRRPLVVPQIRSSVTSSAKPSTSIDQTVSVDENTTSESDK